MKYILFFLLFFLLFNGLGLTKLTNWDEAWYADISRGMFRSGNIITPIFNEEPFFDKPPLCFWLSGIAFNIFGVSEFSARFFSALSGVGVGVIVYYLGRLLFNNAVATVSFTIIASTIGFLYRSRTGNLDTMLTFFLTLSIFSFYQGYIRKSKNWFYILGVSIGLGFLTKGAVLFGFPILAAFYVVIKKDYVTLRRLIIALMIGFSISLGWTIISIIVNGQKFIKDFYLNQTGKISTTSYFWQNFSLEYINHLKSGLKFWFLLLIPSLFYVLNKWRSSSSILLVIYFLLFFTLLMFSENKSNWFLVPLYPILAMIIGYSLFDLVKKFVKQKYASKLILIVVFTLALFQLIVYRNEYMVADISNDEAQVGMAVKRFTTDADEIYLTNYYYPTIVYYSDRRVFAVYSDNEYNATWWVKSKTDWKAILKKERVFIITTEEELKNLNEYFSDYKFNLLYQSGEKLLLKKV